VAPIATEHDAAPPVILRLAGHPVRWRLLQELATSDRHVRELCGLTSQPQSLVSYHLGRLRAEQLVAMRRSSADGRAAYYSLDLGRCGELLTAAGGALHPGLRLVSAAADARPSGARPRLLFLCTGNSARSQMAEALVERLAGDTVEVASAGSHPKPLHAGAVRAMRGRGIDIAGRRSKHLDAVADRRFDYVVSLCDRVREVCPELPGQPATVHWSIPDPSREGDDAAFRATAAELATRIPFLLARVAHEHQPR
jgi:protein-tyrosine-phosphatase/DNA-binding transcriptional ArsR family regulator